MNDAPLKPGDAVTVVLPADLVETIGRYRDRYCNGDKARDPSGLGALNAVAYIGECIVDMLANPEAVAPVVAPEVMALVREAAIRGLMAEMKMNMSWLHDGDLSEYVARIEAALDVARRLK